MSDELTVSFKVWYPAFVDELEQVAKLGIDQVRLGLCEYHWQLGKLVEDKVSDFERSQIYGEDINKKIVESLRARRVPLSVTSIKYCRLFYKKYPGQDWSTVLTHLPNAGNNLSWNKVVNQLLPGVPEKHKHEYDIAKCWTCIICGKKVFSDPYEGKTERSTVIELIYQFKESFELEKLDGGSRENWEYAKRCIKKVGVDKTKEAIDIASKDKFWKTNMTSFKTLFNNLMKLLNLSKEEEVKVPEYAKYKKHFEKK